MFFTTGLDIAAVFGSPAAYRVLCQQGDTNYNRYNDIYQMFRERLEEFDQKTWHTTLYNSWLYCLYLIVQPRGEGYPDFMTTGIL